MQQRALGILFCVLAAALAVVAVATLAGAGSGGARRWLVGVAAAVLAVWLGSIAVSALRR